MCSDEEARAMRETNTRLHRRIQTLESNEGMQYAFRNGYEHGLKTAAGFEATANALTELRFAQYKAAVRATLARLLRNAFTRTSYEDALRQFDLENPL